MEAPVITSSEQARIRIWRSVANLSLLATILGQALPVIGSKRGMPVKGALEQAGKFTLALRKDRVSVKT
ncbi:MAG: hypothetical protein R3212_05125 [Xanthomonadales bacterium]|nr:hypothetical protein [Xanthomonadales bacterium]